MLSPLSFAAPNYFFRGEIDAGGRKMGSSIWKSFEVYETRISGERLWRISYMNYFFLHFHNNKQVVKVSHWLIP